MTREKTNIDDEIAWRADEMIFLVLNQRERTPSIRDAKRLVALARRGNIDNHRLAKAIFRKTYKTWENYHKIARDDFRFWVFYTAICFLFAGIVIGFLAGTLF